MVIFDIIVRCAEVLVTWAGGGMADARDLKSRVRKDVGVRLSPRPPLRRKPWLSQISPK